MTKTTQSARGQTCTLNVAGVCNYQTETVVFCHAPSEYKGMGNKSLLADGADFGAYGCHDCHAYLDRNEGALADRLHYWLRGIFRTQRRLFEMGVWKA